MLSKPILIDTTKKHILIVIGMCFCNILTANTNTATIDIELHIKDTTYEIGDKIVLEYVLSFDNGKRFIVPDVTNSFPDFEVLNTNYDSTNLTFFVNIISFDTGNFVLPSIPFVFEDINSRELYTRFTPYRETRIRPLSSEVSVLKEIPVSLYDETRIH